MNAHYLFLALPLVPLVVALVVLTWRARQERKAAEKKRAAEWLAKVHHGERVTPLHRPRYSAPPTTYIRPQAPPERLPPSPATPNVVQLTSHGEYLPEDMGNRRFWPIGGDVVFHTGGGNFAGAGASGGWECSARGNFAGAGASGGWECSARGSDSTTPASSDTCTSSSSDSSSTSNTD